MHMFSAGMSCLTTYMNGRNTFLGLSDPGRRFELAYAGESSEILNTVCGNLLSPIPNVGNKNVHQSEVN